MTQLEIGLIVVALSVTAHALGRFKKAAPVAVFTGILMIGTSGKIISLASHALMWAFGLLGRLGTEILGYSAASIFAVAVAVLGFVFIHDILPKHGAKRRAFYIAIVLGVLVATAATPFAALNQLPATVSQGVSSATSGG
jgi:hypothetical protein